MLLILRALLLARRGCRRVGGTGALVLGEEEVEGEQVSE